MLNDEKFVEWASAVDQNIHRLWAVLLWVLLLALVEAGAILWLCLKN